MDVVVKCFYDDYAVVECSRLTRAPPPWKSMEELPVSNFSAHRLRRSLAEKGRLPPFPPLPSMQKLPDSLPSPPAPPIPPPPASLPDLSPPSTPSPHCPAIHADPDSASAASPTSARPPPPPPPPPLPRPPYYRRFSSPTAAQTTQATSPEYSEQRNESSPDPPDQDGRERLLPEENAQQNPDEGEHATKQKESETQEVPKATTAVGVSLNDHVQNDDGGREEAMRSFILDRFLPAAKAVAADHESSISAASRNRVLRPSASKPEPIQKAPSRHVNNSRARMLSNASRDLKWSGPLHSKQAEKGNLHRHDSMSCGFLCLGIKTAFSHAHRTVFTSARSVPTRSKISAPPPSSRVTIPPGDDFTCSSGEEDGVVSKVKASVHGTWKQRSALIPPSISYSSTSPTTATFRSSSPRYAASLRDSFARGGSTSLCCSPSQSFTSSGSTPLHIQSGSWNLRGSPLHHQTRRPTLKHSPRQDDVGGASWEGTLHEQASGTGLRGTPPHDSGNPNNLRGTSPCDHAIGTPLHGQAGGTSWEATLHEQAAGTPAHDKGNPNNLRGTSPRDHAIGTPLHDQVGGTSLRGTCLQEEAGRTSSKGSPAHDYVVAIPLRDEDGIEDDEPQFYDALTRFNSVGSTPGSLTPYTIGPKSEHEASGDWTNDKAGFIDASSHFETPSETPRTFTSHYKSVGSVASHGRDGQQSDISMGVKTSILSQRVGKVLRLETGGEQAGMQDKDSVIYHLSYEQGASPDPVHVQVPQQQHEQQQLHLRKESFSRKMSCRPSLENMNGVCSSNTSLVPPIFPAKCQKSTLSSYKKSASANDLGWPFGISNYHSGTQRRSFQGQPRSNDRSVPGVNAPSPPLPPSPSGSWLEKAISVNASKSSTLGILQQKGETASASARKKLEFTSSDAKKEVRWEDMVKGSQMQPGQLRFAEEPHHHHPSNLNAVKPLRL